MTFLNPAILFGLVAASIPIVIHLLNLRKLKKVEFSTLQFLKELQKNKIKKIKIKQYLLLLLRTLIILFIVLAFARPTLQNFSLGSFSSTANTTAVIILDNSQSMNLATDNGTSFNNAKSIIKKLSASFTNKDELYILESENEKNLAITKSKISDYLKQLHSNSTNGDIINLISKAVKIIDNSENFNKEIYLISDFQKSAFKLGDSKTIIDSLQSKNVQFYAFDLSNSNNNNLSIGDFQLNNQLLEVGKEIEFSVLVNNYSTSKIENKILSLFLNGKRVAQQTVSLNANESKSFNLKAVVESTGLNEVFAELGDDNLIEDNKRYLAFNIPEFINTEILYANESDTKFIRAVLSADKIKKKIRATYKSYNQIYSSSLDNYNLLVLLGATYKLDYSLILKYVENGGNIILFPSANQTPNEFENGLRKLSITTNVEQSNWNNNESAILRFESIDFTHPILNDLFSNNPNKKFDSPEIYNSFRLNNFLGKKIISLDNNTPFVSEVNVKKGKVIIYNTSPVLASSNFVVKSVFAPLFTKSIIYLASNFKTNSFILPGEIVTTSQFKKSKRIKIVAPNNRVEYATNDDNNQFSFRDTKQNGIYKFYQDEKLAYFSVVNFDKEEAKLAPIERTDFEKLLVKYNYSNQIEYLDGKTDLTSTIYQARFGTELWKYLLLVALFLALIEMYISKSNKKDLATM